MAAHDVWSPEGAATAGGNCAIPDCQICRDAKYLDAIAAKCTPEERTYLNDLYGRMAAAEMELEWRDRPPEPDVVVGAAP